MNESLTNVHFIASLYPTLSHISYRISDGDIVFVKVYYVIAFLFVEASALSTRGRVALAHDIRDKSITLSQFLFNISTIVLVFSNLNISEMNSRDTIFRSNIQIVGKSASCPFGLCAFTTTEYGNKLIVTPRKIEPSLFSHYITATWLRWISLSTRKKLHAYTDRQ